MDQPLSCHLQIFNLLQWLVSEHLILYHSFLTVCSLLHLIHNLKRAHRQTIIRTQYLQWELLAKFLQNVQA